MSVVPAAIFPSRSPLSALEPTSPDAMRSKQRKTNSQTKTVRWALRLIQMRSTPNPPIASAFFPSTSVFQTFDSAQTKPKFRSHCALTVRSWRALTCPTSQSQPSEYHIQMHRTGLRPALIKGHSKSTATLCILNSYHYSTPCGC